jgi:hypothetical protein
MSMNRIISDCSLCKEHSLHVIGEKDTQMLQCLNCGYVSSPKFVGDKETNVEYKKLTDEMKRWAKFTEDRIWIPTIMTLPVGILYPYDDNGNMKWFFAEMKDIPEDKRKDYPDGNGGYYERMYDTDNPIVYNEFFEGMVVITEKMKNDKTIQTPDINLPKLKKMDIEKED